MLKMSISGLIKISAADLPPGFGDVASAAPLCGSPDGLAMLDWRGAAPPFPVALAPTLREIGRAHV